MKRRTIILAALALGALLARPRYRLRGRVTVITGGSRGLGLAMARRFGRRGAKLALLARDADELERARAELVKGGLEAQTFTCDVRDPASIADALRRVEGAFGPVDVLVNNAGTIEVGPLESMTEADYEDAMRTHFWGPYHATSFVVPGMRERGHGRIVNISSIGGVLGVPHLAPYSASKFALRGWSESIAAELRKDGVRVTTVCPGLMRTGSARNATFKGEHRREYAWFSVLDALPFFSISASRAAESIVRACERGDASLVLSTPAKLAAVVHGVAPGLVTRMSSLVNAALPRGKSTAAHAGRESTSRWSPSLLTTLDDRAAQTLNEGELTNSPAH